MNMLDEFDSTPDEPITQQRTLSNLTVDVNDLHPGDMIFTERQNSIGRLAVVTEQNWSTPINRKLESITFTIAGDDNLITMTPTELIDNGWKKLVPISMAITK